MCVSACVCLYACVCVCICVCVYLQYHHRQVAERFECAYYSEVIIAIGNSASLMVAGLMEQLNGC